MTPIFCENADVCNVCHPSTGVTEATVGKLSCLTLGDEMKNQKEEADVIAFENAVRLRPANYFATPRHELVNNMAKLPYLYEHLLCETKCQVYLITSHVSYFLGRVARLISISLLVVWLVRFCSLFSDYQFQVATIKCRRIFSYIFLRKYSVKNVNF